MIRSRSLSKKLLLHTILILSIVVICFPVFIGFIVSTHALPDLLGQSFPLLPGKDFLKNYQQVLTQGLEDGVNIPVAVMLKNSLLMALLIALGKIIISLLSAFALVYFKFPFRSFIFWLIFLTLMLPVEVRILPTFQVVSSLNLLNTYAGLTLPLIASATATFLFRQFYLTIPDDLTNAAKLDGVGPVKFLIDFLLPLSKTNIAALFIIMFIYGWNQYLWPLIVTTSSEKTTIVMGMQQLASVVNRVPQWNLVMAIAILASLPPVVIIIIMQRLFVKGLIEVEK